MTRLRFICRGKAKICLASISAFIYRAGPTTRVAGMILILLAGDDSARLYQTVANRKPEDFFIISVYGFPGCNRRIRRHGHTKGSRCISNSYWLSWKQQACRNAMAR